MLNKLTFMPQFPSAKHRPYLPNTEITDPSVTSDLLMLAPSLSLCPVAPDASALSLIRKYCNFNQYNSL